ncbi:MAG TPA: thioesterase family protein [Nevskiaceae bacterium]
MVDRHHHRCFERNYRIHFSHCDPAGIVFFPQYFVMFNNLVEDWFNDGLHVPYAQMVASRRVGLPTVHIDVDFRAISRFGEDMLFGVEVLRAGAKSLSLALDARHGDEMRVELQQVLVFTSLDTHRSINIPDDIRAALQATCGTVDP